MQLLAGALGTQQQGTTGGVAAKQRTLRTAQNLQGADIKEGAGATLVGNDAGLDQRHLGKIVHYPHRCQVGRALTADGHHLGIARVAGTAHIQ